MSFSFIMMSCGYVENANVSLLLYSTHFLSDGKKFETRGEAITELALDLYAKYYDEYLSAYENRYTPSFEFGNCCIRVMHEDKTLKFCPICNKDFSDRAFENEAFTNWIVSLHGSTSDSYGESESTNTRNLVWATSWSAKALKKSAMSEVIMIEKNAEIVLLEALIDAMPELITKDNQLNLPNWETDWQKFKKNQQPY